LVSERRRQRSEKGALLADTKVLVGPAIENIVLVARVRAELFDEAAHRIEANDMQVDADARLDQAGPDMAMFPEDRACLARVRGEKLGDQEALLGLQMLREMVVEFVPEDGGPLAIVRREGTEKIREQVLELPVVGHEPIVK
jgi:hypothetical protein